MRRGTVLLGLLLATSMVPATVAASPAEDAQRFDGAAAAGWMTGARWDEVGLFTELPNQVVYPQDTHRIFDTLDRFGAGDRVDAEHPAWSTARLQLPSGGFLRFQADSLGPWTGSTAYALRFAQDTDAPIDEEAAVEFLQDRQNDDGGFGPRLSALGGNLPSFTESTYAAVTGLQAAGALDEATREDALAFLNATQNDDGGWPTSMYNPDRSTMTGTWFAVRTLLSLDALNASTEQAAVEFVLSLEAETGGFAASDGPVKCGTVQCADIGEEITTYSTARAIQLLDRLDALDRTGTSLVDHADWLADRQVQDGYFEGAFRSYQESPLPTEKPDSPLQPSPWAPFDGGVTHFSLTTQLALEALASLDALDRADEPAAVDYLVSLQHPGTGGFGWWPGYVASLPDTGYATRALATLDRLDLANGEAMADTLGDLQRDSGAITEIDWDYNPRMDHTAQALLSLARVDELDAIDTQAAAGYVADQQTDEGGFRHTESQYTDPSIWATDLAVRALAAADALDRANRSAATDWLADRQADEGQISPRSADDAISVTRTAQALRALSVLDALNRIDTQAAADFLASWQTDDGTYRNTFIAGSAVEGLATLGELDAIETDPVAAQLADTQVPRGTTIPAIFYAAENNAFRQHAVVAEAADTLGLLAHGNDPCVERPTPGDVPASLYLEGPTAGVSLERGEQASIPLDVAQAGYRFDRATFTAEAPAGLAVEELDRQLPPLLIQDETVTLTANWTAPTGTSNLTLCTQDEGGGHARAQVPVTVEAPPTEQLTLDAEPLDVAPGEANATTVEVANTGDHEAELRLDASGPPQLELDPASRELVLAPGETAAIDVDVAVPATCSPSDRATIDLRAWGPGGGEATSQIPVNVTDRPAERFSLDAPNRAEVPTGASTPVDVTVTNEADHLACLDATAVQAEDPLAAHLEPDQVRLAPGETTELSLVVDTPETLEADEHAVDVRVEGQAPEGEAVEHRLTVDPTDLEAPTLSPEQPEEVATGVGTTTAITGEPIRLQAEASDPDGPAPDVRIHPEGVTGPSIDAANVGDRYLAEVTYEEPGSYEVAFLAEDDQGQQTIATQPVTVVDNQPPAIELPDRVVQATTPQGAAVELSANVTDPEGRPIADRDHAWTTPGAFATTTHTGPEALARLDVGEHVVALAVEDAQGAESTAPATIAVDDSLQLDADLLSEDPDTGDRPVVSLLAQRDDGSPVPSPVWINVTHAETGAQVSSETVDPAGTVTTVRLPYDVGTGAAGFNLAGEHVVTVEAHADSRPAAPVDDLETASLELGYTVGGVTPPGPAS